MNTILLLIFFISICLFDYFFFKKSIISTPFIFSFPFILALCDGLIYYKQWQFNLSSKTVLLIIFGTISVTIGSALVFFNQRVEKKDSVYLKRFVFKKSVYIFFSILVFLSTIITVFFEKKLVASYGYPSGNLSEIIGSYNEMSKFGATDISLQGIGAYAYEITFSVGLLFAYLLAREIAIMHLDFSRECCFVYILSIFCVLTVGSRSVSITLVLAFVFILLFFLQYTGQFRGIGSVKVKTFLLMFVSLCFIPIIFLQSLSLIGRDSGSSNSTVLYDFSIYLGAPLKNMDIVISKGVNNSSTLFAENTFAILYQTLQKFGFQVPQHPVTSDFGFQSIGGWFLGNVYTIFTTLYEDFGFLGCCLALFLMGLSMQLLQSICLKKINSDKISVATIMYGYFSYNVFFSFFADMTFQTFFSTVFLKKLFFNLIFCFILNKIVRIKTYE